ncbi:MAG: LPP20 family lipoprotein [Campylobacterota bacterium]|nr:LPP20 family lipoprotein [Campylobacterota bacterium]
MKALFTGILFAIMLISLSACGGSKPAPVVTQKKPLPEWYLTPPLNSDAYLYGVGDGKNLDEAKKHALESMVAQLGISIASRFESATEVSKGYREYLKKSTTSELKSEIAKIRISNYEVIKSDKRSYNHFIALVRSDKQSFMNGLLKELELTYGKITSQERLMASSDLLSRYRFYADASNRLNETFSTLLILSTVDKTFDDSPYLKQSAKISKAFETLKAQLAFSVEGDSDTRKFAEVISVALTDNKMRVVRPSQSDQNSLAVSLASSIETARSRGFDIARIALVIEVRNHQGKIIGGNKLNLTGQATQGMDVAINNASKKLQKLIEKEGLSNVLGIAIDLKP